MIDDVIAIAVIVLIIGGAIAYIVKAKRSGQKCIGCPDSRVCSGRCSECNHSCGRSAEKEEN